MDVSRKKSITPVHLDILIPSSSPEALWEFIIKCDLDEPSQVNYCCCCFSDFISFHPSTFVCSTRHVLQIKNVYTSICSLCGGKETKYAYSLHLCLLLTFLISEVPL